MTETEIMKALEELCKVCTDTREFQVVGVGSMKKLGVILKGFLDLVNRKNAEIYRLNFENLQMVASIKGLEEMAIKEFAERVKAVGARSVEVGHFDSETHEYITLRTDLLDQIAKEKGCGE